MREQSVIGDLHHHPDAEEQAGESQITDLSQINWDDVDERLKAAIEHLPVLYREVFLMCTVEGLRYREVADVLSVPIGTVMSRLFRAKSTLAAQLADLAAEYRLGSKEIGQKPLDGPAAGMPQTDEE